MPLDTVVEEDQIADVGVAGGWREEALDRGVDGVEGLRERLRWCRVSVRTTVGAPFAGHLLKGGFDDAPIGGIAEVGDSVRRNLVVGEDCR